MMSRTFDGLYMIMMFIMLVCLSLVAYDGFDQAAWRDRCKSAGGVPATHSVCVNPAAVIEVD